MIKLLICEDQTLVRQGLVTMLGWWVARRAARSVHPARRARWAALLPLLVLADLLGAHWGAHWVDLPTVEPRYWTEEPESVRRLKADPVLRAIPIIVVTSYALSGDESKARAAGCNAYVSKPYSTRQLLAKIREYVP